MTQRREGAFPLAPSRPCVDLRSDKRSLRVIRTPPRAPSLPKTPGVLYYFEPVVQFGDIWNIDGHELNYPGGMAFYQGLPFSGSDLWFREGIIVPEPSSLALALSGLAGFAALIRRHRNC